MSHPEQLYRLGNTKECCEADDFADKGGIFSIFSYDLYRYLQKSLPEFDQLAAADSEWKQFSARTDGLAAQNFYGQFVSGNFFETFGVKPQIGRMFSEQDDDAAAIPVVVLSYSAWKGHFGGNPALVGSTIFINTHPFTVAGVAQRGFFGDRINSETSAFWMPLHAELLLDAERATLNQSDSHWLYIVGIVKNRTNIANLQAKASITLRD